jgi:hypothetical protein
MTFTISADDPRTIRAIEIAAGAAYWLSGHNPDGHDVYGVPSQREPGHYYIVTGSTCDCADFQNHALMQPADHRPAEGYTCKHILAVRLHRELARAQHQPPPHSAVAQRSGRHLSLVPTPPR